MLLGDIYLKRWHSEVVMVVSNKTGCHVARPLFFVAMISDVWQLCEVTPDVPAMCLVFTPASTNLMLIWATSKW